MIALSDSLHGGAEEALPPYAPSRDFGGANVLLETFKSKKGGEPSLPEYGYTALEPQLPEDSELEHDRGTESDHLMKRRSIRAD